MKYHFPLTRMMIIKQKQHTKTTTTKRENNKSWGGYGDIGTLFIPYGSIKCAAIMENWEYLKK